MLFQMSNLHRIVYNKDHPALQSFNIVAFNHFATINQYNTLNVLLFTNDFIDTNACLDILNSPLAIATLLADRTSIYSTGIIRAINYQHSDGALHFYHLTVVSPDWTLTQNIHTRSFVGQSTLDIITSVLSDYAFDWQLSETLTSSERMHTPLSLRTQADISDRDFVTGLLADIGVSTYWVSNQDIEKLGHWLLVSDVGERESESESERLAFDYSYAQSSVQSGQDSVDELRLNILQLGSHTVTVRADGLAADTIYEGIADDDSTLAFTDTTVLIAAPSRVTNDDDATRLAKQWVMANACQRETYQTTGSMRGLNVGNAVNLYDLPNIGSLSTYCLSSHMIGIEPDNDSVSYHHQAMIQDWLQQTTKQSVISLPAYAYDIARNTGVWASATLLDAAIPYCPYPSKKSFVSYCYTGLTQARTGDTITSTTPSYASTVTEDSLQQTVVTSVYSGISPRDDSITPPLRSLQLSSGATHGWQFAPRDGQPVLLTHWYGDIDSPVISRALYDGIGMGDRDETDVTTGSGELAHRHNLKGGASPRWHGAGLGHSQITDDDRHSGWITGIAQYGLTSNSEVTLLFDDSPNQIGTQWSMNTGSRANAMQPISIDKATFTPNQHVLELGVLRHRYSNHHSTISGHGFRLATDNSLQVTGHQGVLLSSFGIQHTQGKHESAWVNDAGQRQLVFGAQLSETFSEAKQAHLQSSEAIQSVKEVLEGFKTSAQVIDETLSTEVLDAADVMLVSRDSILASSTNTLWTAKDIIRQSGSTQSDVVAGSYTVSADTIDSLSGVGGQAAVSGLHMSANREPLAIQAQGGELQLHSQQSLTIGSESGQVNISSPKRIKLQTSAGASITIDGTGVKLVAPGTITIKAVKKALVAGAKVNAPVIALPTSGLFSKAFDLKKLLPQDLIDQGISYKLINHSKGTEFEGKLDENGQTLRVFGDKSEKVELELIGNVNHKGEIKAVDISDQIECHDLSIEDLFEDCGDNHVHDEDDFGC